MLRLRSAGNERKAKICQSTSRPVEIGLTRIGADRAPWLLSTPLIKLTTALVIEGKEARAARQLNSAVRVRHEVVQVFVTTA